MGCRPMIWTRRVGILHVGIHIHPKCTYDLIDPSHPAFVFMQVITA